MPAAFPNSYYAASAGAETDFPSLQGDITADVCIMGGGFTGLNTAIELAERGLSVVLLEQNRVGWGASGRNGGQVTGSLSGDRAMGKQFRRILGDRTDDYIWSLRWRGHEIIKSRIAKFAIEADLKQGHVQTAMKPSHESELRALLSEAQSRGMGDEVEWVEGAAMRAVIDSPLYTAGLINRRNMHLHPLKLARGEARAAASLGVQIFEDTKVLKIIEGNRPKLCTPHGSVTADRVMLAGNAYHRLGKGKMRGALFPAALGIVATEPLPQALARQINPQDLAVYDNRFVLDYHRLSADNRLIFGGGTNYSGRPSDDIGVELRPAIEATFPQLKDIKIDYGWSGHAGIIINRIPHLGQIAPHIFYAEGYSGHGLATSHIVAEIMAEAITGHMGQFDVFAQVKHIQLPFGTWVGQQALALGMWYYGLREKLR